jgi:hypothetical protein
MLGEICRGDSGASIAQRFARFQERLQTGDPGAKQVGNNYIDALSTDALNWGVMDDAIGARPSGAQGGGS